MSIIGSNILAGAAGQGGGYTIENSLRFRSSASAYLSRTPASAGSQTTWTMSMWVKRGALDVRQFITMSGVNPIPTQVWQVEFDANNKLNFYNHTIGTYRRTTQVFRDSSAWYHIVFGADTNNATAQNRFRCWVNGVEVTAWDVNSTISSGYTFAYNGAYLHGIGAYTYSGNILPLDGYLTEVNFIDGQALTPSDFGNYNEDTGVWQPAKYAGSYGTNGFYLPFSDNTTTTTLAEDASGNGNDWTPNNISLTSGATYDSMTDTPTPYADGGNYAVLNPLDSFRNPVPQQANLYVTNSDYTQLKSNFRVSSGKWYFEWTAVSGSGTAPYVGVASNAVNLYSQAFVSGISWYSSTYKKLFTSTSLASSSGLSVGDVIGISFDCDVGEINYYRNGSLVSTDTTLTPALEVSPALVTTFTGGAWFTASFNFGQRPFAYTPPTGFKALHTGNLPDSAIVDGSQYFDVVTRSGNNSSFTVTGLGFTPDFFWTKCRNTALSHYLADSVRGNDNILFSNLSNAEFAESAYITSTSADGYTIGAGPNVGNYNGSGGTYVDWLWKANGAGVSNTDGSITSTVSANLTSGFSIVTYTGTGANATVGHGLGTAPSMLIVKQRGTAGNWWVWHESLNGLDYGLNLNGTAAQTLVTNLWGSLPTSTVFGHGSAWIATTQVAYCFAEVPGFSKFGSYTGNGLANGPFVFTGFRPAFVMVKRINGTGSWVVLDDARDSYNEADAFLAANSSQAESTSTTIKTDFLSNGFKQRQTSTEINASGGIYIYMAFAETDFANALAR